MDGLVFYAKARAFKAKAKVTSSRLRPRNKALWPRPRINIPVIITIQIHICTDDQNSTATYPQHLPSALSMLEQKLAAFNRYRKRRFRV